MLPNIVLFRGQDPVNDSGLWETDGTGSGTFELTPAGGSALGLTPSSITVLGGQVLFEGANSSGHLGLWTTDGTAAGTVELTSIAGASSAGLAPSDLTSLRRRGSLQRHQRERPDWTVDDKRDGRRHDGADRHHRGGGGGSSANRPDSLQRWQSLFNGANTAGHLGLWVTNGTAAGTQELTGVAAASTTGLDPTDMTVFNNEVLFNGVDANGLSGLWVTDGTAGGTHELVAGAGGLGPGRIKSDRPHGLQRRSPVQRPRRQRRYGVVGDRTGRPPARTS